MRNSISAEAITAFGLGLEIYNASCKHYKEEPSSARILAEAGKQIEQGERSD